jgi:hypothetical protein
MSFTGLFKNEEDVPATSTEDGGGFFTQLYAQ